MATGFSVRTNIHHSHSSQSKITLLMSQSSTLINSTAGLP